jgi:hypothetical protein
MGAAWSLQGLGASARSRLVAIGDISDKIDIVNPRLTDESYPKPETVRRPINHGDRPRCLDLSTRSATSLVSGRVGGRGATVARSRASFCFSLGSSFCGQGVIFIFESFRLSGSTWERSLWNGRLDVIKRLIVRTLPIRGDLL